MSQALFLRLAAGLVCFAASFGALGQEVVLKAACGFDVGSAYCRSFERYVELVNAEGKGVVKINYIGGGPKLMSIFEMGNALKTGVFDILNTNNTFYTNLMPEADAIKLARKSVSEMRKDGSWDQLEKIMNEKMNAHVIARSKGDVPAHFYLRKGAKMPNGTDFSGMKIRSTPIYQPFLIALGATPVRMIPADIYTGMERNVVDGYGWPLHGIDELGLLPVTAYRIDPGFYVVTGEILINLNVWKKLGARQKEVLEFGSRWLEAWLPMYEARETEKAKAIQAAAGIKVIELKGDDAKRYLETAYKAAWEAVYKANPTTGPKLKAILDRSN